MASIEAIIDERKFYKIIFFLGFSVDTGLHHGCYLPSPIYMYILNWISVSTLMANV